MSYADADRLLQELQADPERFHTSGRAHDLLQLYFRGLSLDSLAELLRSKDVHVVRSAAFVASELGSAARPLLGEAIALAAHPDRFVRFHALDVITVCGDGLDAGSFAHVARVVASDDDGLAGFAMRLVSRAAREQLVGAAHELASDHRHAAGLRALVESEPGTIEALIHSSDNLLRRYGAIGAMRLAEAHPELLREAAALPDSAVGGLF